MFLCNTVSISRFIFEIGHWWSKHPIKRGMQTETYFLVSKLQQATKQSIQNLISVYLRFSIWHKRKNIVYVFTASNAGQAISSLNSSFHQFIWKIFIWHMHRQKDIIRFKFVISWLRVPRNSNKVIDRAEYPKSMSIFSKISIWAVIQMT